MLSESISTYAFETDCLMNIGFSKDSLVANSEFDFPSVTISFKVSHFHEELEL